MRLSWLADNPSIRDFSSSVSFNVPGSGRVCSKTSRVPLSCTISASTSLRLLYNFASLTNESSARSYFMPPNNTVPLPADFLDFSNSLVDVSLKQLYLSHKYPSVGSLAYSIGRENSSPSGEKYTFLIPSRCSASGTHIRLYSLSGEAPASSCSVQSATLSGISESDLITRAK